MIRKKTEMDGVGTTVMRSGCGSIMCRSLPMILFVLGCLLSAYIRTVCVCELVCVFREPLIVY